jgi:hypothetical protein
MPKRSRARLRFQRSELEQAGHGVHGPSWWTRRPASSGLSEPPSGTYNPARVAQAKLIPLLAGHLLLIALPGGAVALIAARRGARRIPVLVVLELAGSGVAAMLVFWAFFLAPAVGRALAFAVPVLSLLAGAWALRGGHIPRAVWRGLLMPLVLWSLGTTFLVFLGFLHGGSAAPLTTAANRFTWSLPSDADIPRYFAAWFYVHGHHPTPPVYPGDWLASDRPPLQIGYVLAQQPWGWDAVGLNYQLVSVAVQQLWIVGLWALLEAAGVRVVTRALAMVGVLLSDLAIVNGFFVWPKLLAAAMMLGAAALVITPLWHEARQRAWGGALVAALCALGMLAHGSSAFALVPLVILAAVRGLPRTRWIAVAIAVGVVLYVPWSAYQSYGDPPGNRLTKWMLAGDVGPDNQSVLQALDHAYAAAGLGGAVANKARNLATMAGITGAGGTSTFTALEHSWDDLTAGRTADALTAIRELEFFSLAWSLGLFALTPLIMLLGIRQRAGPLHEWQTAKLWYLALVIGCVASGLLLFGNLPAQAVVHQGSYLFPILGVAAGTVGARAVAPRFAVWWVAFGALISLAIDVPSLTPPPGSSYSPSASAICLLSLVTFAAVAVGPRRLLAVVNGRWAGTRSSTLARA